MDSRDKRILGVLENNARASLKEIARETSIPISVISERLNFMRENGTIEGYRVILSPEKMGKDLLAFIFLDFAHDSKKGLDLGKVAEDLSKLPMVEEAYVLTGSTDALLKIRAKEMSEIAKFLANHIDSKPYIRSARTAMAVERILDPH